MPPITAQQPATYSILEKTEVPNGGTPTYEDVGAPLILGGKSTSPADYDVYYRRLLDSASIKALLLGVPVALPPVVTPDPDNAGAFIARLPYSGGRALFVSGAFTKANTGVLVTHLGGEHFRLKVDPTYRAQFDEGTPIQASFEAEAVMELATHRTISWTPVLLNSTGTKVPSIVQGPVAVTQPAPRTFAEGVPTAFTEDLKAFFSGGAAPLTYEVLNSDGTALTDFVLGSITSGVASLTSQATGAGVKTGLYKVTDTNGKTAMVSPSWPVVANPLPVFLSTPPDRDLATTASGFVETEIATLVSDSEALTLSYVQSDGSALPAGYSSSVVGANLRLTYPTDTSQTRIFKAKAVEQGALARTVLSGPFNVVRTATAIGTAAAITVPENATTRKVIDLGAIIVGAATYSITAAGGGALPANYNVVSIVAGVATVDMTFADNQILSHSIEYHGDAVTVGTTWASAHNPPSNGLPLTLPAVVAGQPVIIDPIGNSDDPAVNLLVAGSVAAEPGAAVITTDGRIQISPENTSSHTVAVTFTMEAGSGGAQTTVTLTQPFLAVIGPVSTGPATIQTQSTDGIAFPSFDATVYWQQGSYPVDPSTIEFYDVTTGNPTGKTASPSNAGTFSISSTGIISYSGLAGFVGSVDLNLGISDIFGNQVDQSNIKPWTHTQLANPGDPPPPDPNTVRPNTLDGKPITQRGMESPMWWSGLALAFKNQRMLCPLRAEAAGAQDPFVTGLKGTHQRITDGELDPSTGWHFVPEGEFTPIKHPRWWQGSGHEDVRQGDWSIQIDIRAGDNAVFSGGTGKPGFTPSWTESGTQAGLTGGVTRFVNNSTPFNYDRRRFIRTLSTADTAATVYYVGGGTGGCWIRYWYSGTVADETTWETDEFRDDWITDASEEKEWRLMDPYWTNDSRAAQADDLIDDGYYFLTGNAGSWASPLTANGDLRKSGSNLRVWAQGAKRAGSTLHVCTPVTLGAYIASDVTNGFYSANFSASAGSAAFTSVRDYFNSIFPSIFAAAKTEFRKQFQRDVQNLIDAGWLDTDRVTFEPSNENWNRSFVKQNRFCEYLEWHLRLRGTITHGVGNSTRGGGGAGYMGNLMATELAQVIAEMKPNQQWEFRIGIQTNTAPSEFTASAIEGWNIFIADNPSRSMPISNLVGSPTDYLSDGYKWTGPKSAGANNNIFGVNTEAEFDTAFIAAYQNAGGGSAGALAIRTIVRDWMINPSSGGSSVYSIINKQLAHKATLEAAGAKFGVAYEGSDHNQVDGSQSLPAAFDAATGQTDGVITLMKGWNTSAEAEQTFNLFFDLKAANGLIGVTNYYKYTTNKNWNGGGPWFEKSLSQLGVAPTSGIALAYYSRSRASAGTITPPANLNEDFEGETIVSLTLAGMTLGNGFTVIDDTGDRALYSTNEFEIASTTLGTTLQANATRAVRLIIRPDGARTVEYGRLMMTSNGDYVAMKPGASGALVLTYLGQAAPDAVTTTGLDLLDGSAHDLTITYYAATSGGVIEVKRTSDNFVYGTISGNTSLHITGGASPHIDAIELRGKVYWRHVENLTGVTPPVPQNEWGTKVKLIHAAGVDAGFDWRVDGAQFPGGAAHEFFQKAQTNGGDIRAYLIDKTTRLPVYVKQFDKTLGKLDLRIRTPSALALNAEIYVKSGGDGTLSQPASDAQYGSKEVYQNYDLYTSDMLVNHATDEIFAQAGGAARSGPNNLLARGYDSQGVNAGDATSSILTTNNAAISSGGLFNRAAKGGGGVGVSDTGFARLFHMQNGDDLMIQDNIGSIVIDREFSTTDGKWTVPYATLNTWAAFSYSHDGTTGVPLAALNGAGVVPSVQTAPVGTFVPGNTTLTMGNHNGFNRNFDGQLCEWWRRPDAISEARQVAWQTMMLTPVSFYTVDAGAAW